MTIGKGVCRLCYKLPQSVREQCVLYVERGQQGLQNRRSEAGVMSFIGDIAAHDLLVGLHRLMCDDAHASVLQGEMQERPPFTTTRRLSV